MKKPSSPLFNFGIDTKSINMTKQDIWALLSD